MKALPGTLQLPALYPKQQAAIFDPKRYAVIEASTKSGKTVGCLAWILSLIWKIGKPGRNFWWVAPVYLQAKNLGYNRLKRMLYKAQRELGCADVFKCNEGELWIEFFNGARLWFKSAERPDNLYGEDVFGCVFDEATRAREEAWWALRTTITATQAPVRIISNVKGRKNWVYRLARKAEAGEPGWHYARLTAYDAINAWAKGDGILAAAEVEDARRQMPEAVWRELYLAEPSDDEGNPFGQKYIRDCIAEADPDRNSVKGAGRPAFWGFDFAKSIDWNVGIGLDNSGDQAGYQRWHGDWKNTIRRTAAMIGQDPGFVDSTGIGDAPTEEIQRLCPQVTGYRFSSQSKQRLMEGLSVAIQSREIRYIEGPIVSELESFEYEYTRTGVRYTAPEGMHDDCVCALALAVACRRQGRGNPLEVRVIGSGGPGDEFDEERWWH